MIENCEIFMNHLDLSFDTVLNFELVFGSFTSFNFDYILKKVKTWIYLGWFFQNFKLNRKKSEFSRKSFEFWAWFNILEF